MEICRKMLYNTFQKHNKGEPNEGHLLNPLDFSVGEIEQLLDLASDIEEESLTDMPTYVTAKKIATLFYEPSTRTRLSFEAAMLKSGRRRFRFCLCRFQLCCKGRKCF